MKDNFMQKTWVIWLGALVCCFLWGSAFPGIKIGYQLMEIDSGDTATQILYAGIRFALAGVLAIIIGSIGQKKFLVPRKGEISKVIKNAKQIYTFYNSKDQEQGKLVYENTKDRTTASINLHTKEKIIEVLYDSKIENLKKNKSYDNSIVFTLKESNKTDNLLSIDINVENKISTDLTIEEDTSNAIFASSVTEEQKTMLSQKKDNILLRLKG